MSTKTNFKRIALVAVAALGMGVLSSAPSQAVIPVTSLTLTASATAGTALVGGGNGASTNIGAISDSTTGASVTVSFLGVTASTDSVSLTIAPKSKPALAAEYPRGLFTLTDTSSSTSIPKVILETVTPGAAVLGEVGTGVANTPSSLIGLESGVAVRIASNTTANRYSTATFKIHMDSATARVAGSYVYTVIATPFDAATAGGAVSANVKSVDVTITVSAGSTTASPSYSKALMNSGSSISGAYGDVDSSISVVATAASTTRGNIRVFLRTATNTTTAEESVTVVTTVGSVGTSAGVPMGKNVTLQYPVGTGYLDVRIFSDGTAGTGTITISTPSVTFAAKSVTFYSTTATKMAVVTGTSVIGVGAANTMTALSVGTIWVKATDANGNVVVADADGASGVFAYSSDKTIISDSGTACAYNSTIKYHTCSLTGVLAGKATISIKNSSTNANAATISGDKTVEVTVNAGVADKLVLEFDKASYTPGEKGYIFISAKDAAGVTLPKATLTNLMATGGITLAGSFSGTAPTLTDVTYSPYVNVASVDTCESLGKAITCLTFYAPYAGTSMKITATGGSLLPSANRVAVSATAAVSDSGAAALAAVTALATTVASLKTLITTLTNLVLKIQKKVKA
jgi:hypothetical protein